MLFLFTGTDRQNAHDALSAALAKVAKKARVVRVSDANSVADLEAALEGAGMFGEPRVVVLDSILANPEMAPRMRAALERLRASEESFFLLEEKPDAATRKLLEKYAEKSERFDAPKKERDGSIFAISSALRKGDKKSLWLQYQHELLKGSAPEAIHGVLFWGAKDMFMKSRTEAEKARAKKLIAELAELPHRSRRWGEEMEYALERFLLSNA